MRFLVPNHQQSISFVLPTLLPKQSSMLYNPLGKSSLMVSEIGFGCMSLKGSENDIIRLLNQALELGINYFDTADLYDQGLNEQLVGKFIKGKRANVLIGTKVGNQWKNDGSAREWNPRKEYILQAIDRSLERLGTDFIDLYQLHGGTLDDPIDEIIEAFEMMQQQGKIRYYGISSIRPNVIREYVMRSRLVSVMMQYSLLDRRPEESCLDFLHEHNIGILARGSLAKGLLVNKPSTEYLTYSKEEVAKMAKTVSSISPGFLGQTASSLQYVLQRPAITSAVVGIRTPEQLEAAVHATKVGPLNSTQLESLKYALPVTLYKEHR